MDLGLADNLPDEPKPQQPLTDEGPADPQLTPVMQQRHASAGAGPARRGVDLPRAPYERVAGDAFPVRKLVDDDVLHGRLPDSRDVHVELLVDRLSDRHAPGGDLLGRLQTDGDA